jgi:hypothetical protein
MVECDLADELVVGGELIFRQNALLAEHSVGRP